MPKNVFTALADYVDSPKRNTFDMSFQNNLTMRFGKLYPVFCKEVIPGDSFRIEPTFGLRFMPLVFPVQTRMQANLHFFYVRNRNLWKDWPDFIGRTKSGLVPPYLSATVAKQVCKTKGLADYLGVPTTLVGDYGRSYESNMRQSHYYWPFDVNTPRNFSLAGTYELSKERSDYFTTVANGDGDLLGVISSPITGHIESDGNVKPLYFYFRSACISALDDDNAAPQLALYWRVGDDYRLAAFCDTLYTSSDVGADPDPSYHSVLDALSSNAFVAHYYSTTDPYADCYAGVNLDSDYLKFKPSDSSFVSFENQTLPNLIHFLQSKFGNLDYRIAICQPKQTEETVTPLTIFCDTHYTLADHYGNTVTEIICNLGSTGITDISDFDTLNPYSSGDIKISALPFRAYESIYNAFYRNQFNDPFKINGVNEYNKFITNNEGGADNTLYELFNRNYEMDFLTSAKQSPVDGDITPLVGVSGSGQFTFKNADDTTYTVTPQIGPDGHTLTGIQSVEGTPENNTGVRRLTDMISVGISINDFRNVNALQRWLETNLRRGYRYKDQIMSHFGVGVRYDEMDMPEFIGGMSEPVLVNQVSQTVDATDSPSGLGDFSKVLGSFAGQASVLASSNHDITKYCDEHGFIIGILSICPVPNYSQLLPKMFTKDNVLDYYFPEFGHIGNQPIPYREVTPLQSFAAGDSLNDVFGYQRAWYDYLASVDEVHGDFRTSLDGFLINRVFDERPQLGKSFIEVDDTAMSNPFSVTGDEDKILGQIYFKVTAQRPIPKLGIPRLE